MGSSQIIDVAAELPRLSHYYFLGDSASTTINGFFVDIRGARTGSAFTATVTTGTAQTLADIAGTSIPADAVGAILDFSADTVYDISTGTAATVKSDLVSNKANHPTIVAGKNVTLGRVA